MRPALLTMLLVCGPLAAATAQQPKAHPPQPGTVTGHVMCADTQRPARLVKVALVAVAAPAPTRDNNAKRYADVIGRSPATDFVETGLDGSFTISNVPPGAYYIIVDASGYTSPLAQFDSQDLESKDAAFQQQMAKTLLKVNVRSNATINQDVALERGASVSGTVTYDDGSPASGLDVDVLQKDAAGKWKRGAATRYRAGFGHVLTDDEGHYRVTGLEPGKYLVEVDLTLSEYTTRINHPSDHPDQATVMRMQTQKYSLPLFSGSALRQSAATPISLAVAEQRAGADLDFPLSKLHSVSGQLWQKTATC